MKEFDLIENFFASLPFKRKDVVLGIGDDAALIKVPGNKLLVASTDTLVEGVHFFKSASPHAVGYKSLAVSLSDLAAMGATPCWVSLSITLPSIDLHWLEGFMQGFTRLFEPFNLQLTGGDTTQGPLSITVHVSGIVDPCHVLRRDAAKAGDLIYVTGTLGDAAFALDALQKNKSPVSKCLNRLDYPTPRVLEGINLGHIANSAIDISDGLLSDLNHVLMQSNVGALLFSEKLPLSKEMQQHLPIEKAIEFALVGGDDYELCITVAPNKESALCAALEALQCSYTGIGVIQPEKGLYLKTQNGVQLVTARGYQHFCSESE